MSVPKRSNRISRREAAQICSKIRAGFMELRNDEAIAYRGYVVFEDWKGELSRTDQALAGWVDCWDRFNSGLDLTPQSRLSKKLANGIALTIAEIDDALALLNQQEKALAKMPRDFVQDQTNTELIAISMDELGISREAA